MFALDAEEDLLAPGPPRVPPTANPTKRCRPTGASARVPHDRGLRLPCFQSRGAEAGQPSQDTDEDKGGPMQQRGTAGAGEGEGSQAPGTAGEGRACQRTLTFRAGERREEEAHFCCSSLKTS